MEKVYVFLADGFEEIEGLTVVDVLRRGGIEVCTVSINGNRQVMGSHRIPVLADALFEELPCLRNVTLQTAPCLYCREGCRVPCILENSRNWL